MNTGSHIYGTGYGSKHIWENIETRQLPYWASEEDKCTTYKCSKCNENFYHYYGIQSCIFTALEDAKVKEECT